MTADAAERTTAQVIVELLKLNGIRHLFCLPGMQNDNFFDALYDARNEIRPIHTRHEQGAGYMALGAAQATGDPAAYCVVPGPGFLNTATALATGYSCNAPIFALVGQLPAAQIDKGFGLLHEIPDQLGIMQTLTKWARRVDGPGSAVDLMGQAWTQMLSGRPRPVGLECPMDVWTKSAEVEMPAAPFAAAPAEVDPDRIADAAKRLGQASNPMIFVGGGAQGAAAEVRHLAEMLQAPVVAFRMGRGVLDSRHPLSLTLPAGHRLWAEADVVLAVGTRLQPPQMQWGVDPELQILHLDVDDQEIGRITEPAVALQGDAATGLRQLLEQVPRHNRRRDDRSVEIDGISQAVAVEYARLQPQVGYLEAIRRALPEDGIFVDELTQLGYVSRFAFPVYAPRTFLSTGYQGTLGWGYATALGAKVACPDQVVVSIAGDGGFMFNVQEIATAVQHQIPVIAIVFNDGAFGNVRRIQKYQYNDRTIASDLQGPNFVALAESCGAMARSVETPDALQKAIETAIAANVPAVIEVRCGEMPSPWEYLQMPRVRPASA